MAKAPRNLKKKEQEFSYEEREGRFVYIGQRRPAKISEIGFIASHIRTEALRHKSPLFARLSLEWENFVGAALAQQSSPVKLNQNVLTVKCQGPAAVEMQYLAPQLLKRLNESCGLKPHQALKRIKILQTMPQGNPSAISAQEGLPARPHRKLSSEVQESAQKELEGIESGTLKALFEKLLSAAQTEKKKR